MGLSLVYGIEYELIIYNGENEMILYEKEDTFFMTDGRFGKFEFSANSKNYYKVKDMERAILDALQNYREDRDFAVSRLDDATKLLSRMAWDYPPMSDLAAKQKKRVATLKALIKGGADITGCDGNFAILSDVVMISLSNRTWKRLEKEEWFKMENVRQDLKALIEEISNYERIE
jgi:hypothetical protein